MPSFPGFSLHLPLGGGWRLHLHHWLYLSIGIAALLLLAEERTTTTNVAAVWFMFGGAVQGIYAFPEDWYHVIYQNKIKKV